MKIFHGTVDDAKHVAMLDGDQHEVDSIRGYRGDPTARLSLQFLVRFRDGDEV